MPRFRITKELPVQLCYRGGATVTVEVVDGMWGGQRLLARRTKPTPGNFLYLCDNDPGEPLAPKLARGFEVEAGGPGETILRSLVARGYAEGDPAEPVTAPC